MEVDTGLVCCDIWWEQMFRVCLQVKGLGREAVRNVLFLNFILSQNKLHVLVLNK